MNLDFNKPFRITIEFYDTVVTVEKDHSDLELEEFAEIIVTAIDTVGFNRNDLYRHLIEIFTEKISVI